MQALSCVVIVICIPTEHLGVHNNSLKRVRAFKIELEFGNIFFLGERKTGVPRENLSEERREPTTNSTHVMTATPGFEPRPHWWEASALTTTPSFSAPLKIIIVGTGDGLKQLRCE